MNLKVTRAVYLYIFAFLISITAVLANLYLPPFVGSIAPFWISLFAVILSGILGGLRTGLITTLITASSLTFLFFRALGEVQINIAFEIIGFILLATLISFVFEKYKRTDIVDIYEKREREYVKELEKLRLENSKVLNEIKVRDEFLSIASHELKNPLTSMLLKLQTILHNVRNVSLANFSVENLLKMLETAEGQTKRLSKMINDLLNVSLITTGRLNLEVEKADLSLIVKQVTEEFTEKLKKDGYKLSIDAKEPVWAQVDRLRIEQMITNLLSNAIKYGNRKPIEVRVEKENSHATISVVDQGIGIGNKQKERIFALFDRGLAGNNNHEGLGVGLYIANQIVKAHNGKIKVESKQNEGSTFIVELPLKHARK